MYSQMLRYRLLRHTNLQGRLNLGYVSESDPMRAVFAGSHVFHLTKDCGVTVLNFKFEDQTKSSLAVLAGELAEDALGAEATSVRLSDMELLAAVIARGDVHGNYGNHYWGNGIDTVHLLVCGIDWSCFRGVHSQQWSNFDGTFSEGDRYTDVLGTRLTCRCDNEVEVDFGLEPPSLAQLIMSLGAGELERIFDV